MKVFVSTKDKRGDRGDDFSWTNDGELVTLPALMCDNGCQCGCSRSMSGMVSHKGTTTFKVVELPMTPREYGEAFLESMIRAGWFKREDEKMTKMSRQESKENLRLAGMFPVGLVLEKTPDKIVVRK